MAKKNRSTSSDNGSTGGSRTRLSEGAINDFIRAWQGSDNSRQVSEKLGLSPAATAQRAGRLRKLGVPLKRMRKPSVFTDDTVSGFKDLAESLA